MSGSTFDTLFRGANVVNHEGEGIRDIGVSGGAIIEIGNLSRSSADEVVDCTGLHILPGVIDSQVHFREPGAEHKEDLQTGSLAAVMGGVTCVFEMPNTNPTTTSDSALADKIARGTGRMHCDFAFWVGGTHENARYVGELERLPGCAGIKVFMGSSTGNLLVEDDTGVREILSNTRRRSAFHSEDEPRLRDRVCHQKQGVPASHPVWRDAEAAMLCTRRLVGIAEETGARIHVLHISTAQEMPFLAQHKSHASVEVTPHHLTLSSDDYAELGTYLQMNPPVRDKGHQAGIWWGVENGVADVLGSDHAPHTRAEKDVDYPKSPSGMPGVQTLVPIMLNHVAEGRLSLARFVDMSSHGPQRLFGLAQKGRIAAGYDADLTIVDLKARWTISDEWIASRCGWTPYDGMTATGKPVGTVVRGQRVMWEGDLVAPALGQPALFAEALGAA